MALGQITLNFDPIRDAIFDWLHASLNGTLEEGDANEIPVIRSEDNQVRPKTGFVEYKFLTSFLKIGRDEVIYDEDNTTFKVRGQREFVVTINVISSKDPDQPSYNKAAEWAAEIMGSVDRPSICDILVAAGLSVRDDDAFTDASVFLDTDHEERQVLDFRFGIALEKVDAVTTIDSVQLKNQLIDPNAADEYTVTIN